MRSFAGLAAVLFVSCARPPSPAQQAPAICGHMLDEFGRRHPVMCPDGGTYWNSGPYVDVDGGDVWE